MSDWQQSQYTILAPGFAKWWGSDGRALAQAFRRMGHNLVEIDEEDYVPWRWEGLVPKISRRLLNSTLVKNYNDAVLRQANSSYFDFVLVFKGNLIRPETLRSLTQRGKPVFNFYPDTNFTDYGSNIPAAMSVYDCVFTTKSFHGLREQQQFRIRDLQHVRHGFDPEVHRPIAITSQLSNHYGCDVSFVGCWSPENEAFILNILDKKPDVDLRVYGLGWQRAAGSFLNKMGSRLFGGAFGDELAVAYSASKINLGLLRRAQSDPSIQDQTTARTFQIPATNAFLLHEDTPEVRTFFRDHEEIMLFNDPKDMLEKIEFALRNPSSRDLIRKKGYERCMREPYDYSRAAGTVVRYFEARVDRGALPRHESQNPKSTQGEDKNIVEEIA